MTKREVFEAMITGVNAGTVSVEGMEKEEVVAFFENEITNLDKRAERSRANAAKKREASDAMTETIKGVLTEEYQTIADIVEQLEGEDITASKVIYRLNTLVKANLVEKADVQVSASENVKARVVKGYRLTAPTEEA